MSPVTRGTRTVLGAYRGSLAVQKILRGTTLVWEKPAPTAETYFNSDFTTRGDTSAYSAFINADDPARAAVVTSPTDPGRKVLRMASQTGVTHGNDYPRTAVETSAFVKSLARGNTQDVYYNAVSFYLSDEFTTMTDADWLSIIGLAWGPPWSGSGSVTIQMRSPAAGSDEHRLMLGGAQLPIGTAPRNQWVNLIVGFKFAYEEEGGWVSLWRHDGTTWNQVPIEGNLQHPFNPLILGGNDGWHTGTSNMANTSRVTVYGSQPQVVHFGEHFVASTFAAAAQHFEPVAPIQNWQLATVDAPASVRSYTTSSHAYAASTETVSRPPQVSAGDLLVLYTLIDSGDLLGFTVPEGFTELGRVTANPGVRYAVSYKVAGSTEPASYTYTAFPEGDGVSMIVAVKDWDGNTANLVFAMSPDTNTTMDTPSITPATTRNLLLTSIATDNDASTQTWGWRAPVEAATVGYAHNASYWCSGAVSHEVYNSTTATGPRTWEVTTSATQPTRMTASLSIGSGTRTATITDFLDAEAQTAGSGGELIDATNLEFTDSAGVTSRYHLYAEGLDWTKRVGMLVYTDGSGEWGLTDPNLGSTYLLGGTNGMIAVAKRQNMILLTPKAPGGGCDDGDGVCWYDDSAPVPATETTPAIPATSPWQKLEWSNELIRDVLTRYDIDRRRIAIGGYSSGAQWTTAWWGPKYASEVMLDGVAVAISYGGPPRAAPNVTDSYRGTVDHIWDVGDLDDAYRQPKWDDNIWLGRDWYRTNGFAVTRLNVVEGKTHDRSGEFGPIMEREITARVMNADGTIPTPPAPPVVTPVSLRGVETRTVPAETTDKTITYPTGVAAGDALVLVLAVSGTDAGTTTLPAGFTLLRSWARHATHSVFLGYRTAAAGDATTLTPTIPAGCSHRADLMAYQDAETVWVQSVSMVTTAAVVGEHPAPSVTPTTDNGMLVSFISGGGGNTWTPPATMTEVTDSQTGASHYTTLSVAQESITSSAETGTRSFVNASGAFTQTAGSIFIPSKGSA